MATSAMILGMRVTLSSLIIFGSEVGLATPKTLVLVDELGRGTSTIEGVGIAHAIAEELIRIKCFVFFATYSHFYLRLPTLPVDVATAISTSYPRHYLVSPPW